MAERYVDVIYGHDDSVQSIGYSPDGTLLISGGGDGMVRFWSIQKHRCIEQCDEFKSSIISCSFSPDGKGWAAMDRDGNVHIHNINGTKSNAKFMPYAGFRWMPNSRGIVGGTHGARICIFNLAAQQPLHINRHYAEVFAIAVSPDGRYIASGGNDFCVRLWDTVEGRELPLLEYHKNPVSALAFSPDSKTLASGDKGSSLAYWDMEIPGNKGLKFSFNWSTCGINDVMFCPSYNIFATTGDDNRIKLFDIGNNNRRLEDLTGHSKAVQTLAFSPCGKFLASAGLDRKIMVWNVKKPNYVS